MAKSDLLNKIINPKTGRTLIVPMDHGIGMGPIKGLENMTDTIDKMAKGGANAVLFHKGIAKHCMKGRKDVAMIIHLSASTSVSVDPNAKVLICTPEEAKALGATAVSVHINIGSLTEQQQLKDLGWVSGECERLGLPLLAMMYVRGPNIKDPKEHVALAARTAFEAGADIIKVSYTGSIESFKKVTGGVDVPVVIAGGDKVSERESLQLVKDALAAGAAGVCMGRNAFQSDNPTKTVRAVAKIIHENASVEEALQ
ncbi:2-amino-3,7-dideoxy-D-threo-hept-6-ulosonate synthase [Candidatus Gugararchaeum adminiculabundum]|nr:2-amino-3,7-dideoxy-D-threo-hept-6-ulosonate synthase [Candidatus Gugararchaeum adminiculabundum]